MPSQSVNDSTTVATAGNHTRPTTSTSGTATIRITTTRSQPRKRCSEALPPRRRAGANEPSGGVSCTSSGGRTESSGGTPVPDTAPPSVCEDRLLLVLDVAEDAGRLPRVLDEALQRRDHHRGREVRAGVAVQELRDVL